VDYTNARVQQAELARIEDSPRNILPLHQFGISSTFQSIAEILRVVISMNILVRKMFRKQDLFFQKNKPSYTQLQKCCPLDFSKKTKNFCEELETLKNFKKLS
jgi:hypothetical protein